jgi:hypothetical protein
MNDVSNGAHAVSSSRQREDDAISLATNARTEELSGLESVRFQPAQGSIPDSEMPASWGY